MLYAYPPHLNLYHTFDLPNGKVVKGFEDTPGLYRKLLPFLPDMRDKTVLDVGAWDGYYSFKMEKLGAKFVLATDHFCWSGPGWGNKEGFEAYRTIFNSNVVDLDIDPSDINPHSVGFFDVVLYLGVLYHRPDCFQAFANAACVCKQWLIVETMLNGTIGEKEPLFSFHPFNDLGDDPTNWFVPNISGVKAMYEASGFVIRNQSTHESPLKGYPRGIFVGERVAEIKIDTKLPEFDPQTKHSGY